MSDTPKPFKPTGEFTVPRERVALVSAKTGLTIATFDVEPGRAYRLGIENGRVVCEPIEEPDPA